MKLNFRKYGNGFPIIILHGLYGSSDNWFSIGKKLAKNYSVYLIDQRNHGKSEHHNSHNYDLLSKDLSEFIKKNRIEKTIIIGHSMGGKVAMSFANKFPNKVKSLIIVDISPFSYSEKNAKIHNHILESLAKINLKTCKTRVNIENQLSEYIKQDALRKFLLKNIARHENKLFYWKINLNILKNSLPNILEGLACKNKIETPTLFIKGENSDYIKNSEFDKIRTTFTKSEFIEIKNAGHWLHAEQPEEFCNIINQYLKKI